MKKILFVSARNPFSGRYSGDVIRAKKFIYFLSRNNYVKVISTNSKHSKRRESKMSYEGFKKTNFLLKIFNILLSVIKLQPLQLGYFYSEELSDYVKKNYKFYDLIFFQSFRTAQYLPKNCTKKSILDMGDLVSNNYDQTSKRLIFLNPLRLVYWLEGLLLKKYETVCLKKFDKILLHSKKEIGSLEKKYNKKITQIAFGVDQIKKKFKFNSKNNKIIFIGNIKYVPNKNACFDFIKYIFPKIIEVYPDIEFHIIGEISKIDKFFFQLYPNVKILNKVDNLDSYLDKVICGLANLKISSGIQTKLLTYMSYGIPSICSKQVVENFDAIKESKINYYKDNKEMIKLILKLKNNKKFSLSASKRSLKIINKFKWNKILPTLNKVIY